MPDLKLNSPLQYVKSVGPKKAAALAGAGLETVRDILSYFPRHYLDRSSVTPINRLQVDQTATVIGEVRAHGLLHGRRRRYEAIIDDGTAHLSLLFFGGVRYWEQTFKKGQLYAVTGTVSYFQGYQIIHPDMERLEDESDKMVHAGRIIPVYPQTAELSKLGLSSKGVRAITTFIFEHLADRIDDPLPEAERNRLSLPHLHEATKSIHYPEDREQVETCRRRLAYDELLQLQYLVYQSKGRKEVLTKSHSYAEPGPKLTEFRKRLPFEMTSGQKKVIGEIFSDLRKTRPMSRLLHGDVGCGKTLVAIAAALYAAENGMQTAFMAPTEILAEQHYRNWSDALAELGVSCSLLTSSLKPGEKKKRAKECAEGRTDILFGTHALVYDYVSFPSLGLVIIDEQHRFGVEQRGKLYAKGDNPDLLVMTATPIPRTLALTLYGDLEISTIEGMPPGRKPIRTAWRAADARAKVYEFIRTETATGGQAYMVYPLIEKSEQVELENVEDAYRDLADGALKGLRLGLIHGRVKGAERDRILTGFRNGEIDVLLGTTVVEVGIDNPNASIMMIEHAERFGLAQLHQLRGRVGRGERQSTVVAIAHPPLSDIARQRLTYFADCADGFQIAEADLELRGPGEIFGRRQSGLPELKAANFWRDSDLLEASRALLDRIFSSRNQLDRADQALYNYLREQTDRKQLQLGGG